MTLCSNKLLYSRSEFLCDVLSQISRTRMMSLKPVLLSFPSRTRYQGRFARAMTDQRASTSLHEGSPHTLRRTPSDWAEAQTRHGNRNRAILDRPRGQNGEVR
jgi:hypothetical protein